MSSQRPLPGIEASMHPALEAWPSDAAQAAIDNVSVERVKDRLLTLASLHGDAIEANEGHPGRHYATNRLALSAADVRARRDLITPWMEEAEMEVASHPLAVIGRLPGKESSAPPLAVLSHVDTVPKGDMYDGTLGVIAGIEAVQAMRQTGIETHRDVLVFALTGEESAAFGFPLFGSRGIFHGLTKTELGAINREGQQLSDALGPDGVKQVSKRLVGKGRRYPLPLAGLELHVEQASHLEQGGIDIGIVEAIAAPERYRVLIGNPGLEVDQREFAHEAYLELRVAGKADHSGTTPMSAEARADGLLATAKFLQDLLSDGSFGDELLTIGDIHVEAGSINKIPGLTVTQLRIATDRQLEFEEAHQALQKAVEEYNTHYELEQTGFGDRPLTLEAVDPDAAAPRFFRAAQMTSHQLATFDLIKTVNSDAVDLAERGVTGTVGTFTTLEDGRIELEVDIRGTSLEHRDKLVESLRHLAHVSVLAPIELGEPLPGSGKPALMDGRLVGVAEYVLRRSAQKTEVMSCLAGHDIQNVVRAGIPGLLMLCQSNNGGLAHHPEAYTADEHLLSGVRALASLVTLLSTTDGLLGR